MPTDEHSELLSRGEAIRKGALATGALLGLGTFGPYVRKALALAGESDPDTLNLLLLFEYIEVDLFEESKTRLNAGPELRELIAMLQEQERGHVEALTKQIKKLGGTPLPKRDFAVFGYRPHYIDVFLQLARELETNVIAAYNGAIPLLKSQEAVRLAASIVQVEGRHAATLAMRGKAEPAPEAFDPVRTEYLALNSLIRFTGPIESPSG